MLEYIEFILIHDRDVGGGGGGRVYDRMYFFVSKGMFNKK